jgi:Ferritin-like
VGHLYRSIERGLTYLADRPGEDRLFIGPAFQQADETTFGWSDLRPITGLAGAGQAIERIVEQGEGARGDWADAHYGRFLAVLDDYRALRAEDPAFEPAHPVAAAAVRGVEGFEPDVYISDPATGGCSDLFNAVYELLLQMIARYFAFGHETPGQRRVLAHTAVDLMFGVIKPLGPAARRPAGRPRSPWPHGGSQLPAPVPGQFPAAAPPLGLAPLRRAPGRAGRLRRRPPPGRGSRRGAGRGRRAIPDSRELDRSRRGGVMPLPPG